MRIGFLKIELLKAEEEESGDDVERPVRFVPDGVNSWRIVWAD